MRLRRKPWARPELAACPFCVDTPESLKGRWENAFSNNNPIHLELGCGKGLFISETAFNNPETNYIGIDIKSEVLGIAKRNTESVFGGKSVGNLLLMSYDIERITEILSPDDKISKIYINFCNPWPKKRDYKHRLTHTRQLEKYRSFLVKGGELVFKTDNLELFEATQQYLQLGGFCITEQIYDLSAEHPSCRYMSEHEIMFRNNGNPIYYIVAKN